MAFNIAVMGCGVVGSGVADILLDQGKKLSERFGTEVALTRILDIRNMEGTRYEKYMSKDASTIINDPDISIVVVTIGGLDFAYAMAKNSILAGKHVVTSNKEVVAAHGRELTRLAFEHNVRFLYEASAGGGIPIIRPLEICLSGNDITEIQGILNGTTNFMLTNMKKEKSSFEEVLKKAQELGFAEANPSADVDGFDAARKIAILSSLAYDKFIDYADVRCKGIREITEFNHEYASREGYTIKLIAGSRYEGGKVYIYVEPMLLPDSSMLAGVSYEFNAVLVKGSYTGETLFYGKGAGKLATASAVVGDIVEILMGAKPFDRLPGFVTENAELGSLSGISAKRMICFSYNKSVAGSDVCSTVAEAVGLPAKRVFAENGTGYVVTKEITDTELTNILTVLGESDIREVNSLRVLE